MKKSGLVPVVTTRVAVTACVSIGVGVLSVPLIVIVYVPAGVVLCLVTVNVEVPDPPVIGFGLNEPLAPLGSPLTLRVRVSVKPLMELTVTV